MSLLTLGTVGVVTNTTLVVVVSLSLIVALLLWAGARSESTQLPAEEFDVEWIDLRHTAGSGLLTIYLRMRNRGEGGTFIASLGSDVDGTIVEGYGEGVKLAWSGCAGERSWLDRNDTGTVLVAHLYHHKTLIPVLPLSLLSDSGYREGLLLGVTAGELQTNGRS